MKFYSEEELCEILGTKDNGKGVRTSEHIRSCNKTRGNHAVTLWLKNGESKAQYFSPCGKPIRVH